MATIKYKVHMNFNNGGRLATALAMTVGGVLEKGDDVEEQDSGCTEAVITVPHERVDDFYRLMEAEDRVLKYDLAE